MGMTFSQLQAAVATHIDGAELEPAQLALWLNEAQNDLSMDFGPVREQPYDGGDGTTQHSLPDDCVAVLSTNGEYGYMANGNIIFPAGGTVTVSYRAFAMPFDGVNGSQESELMPSVHYLLPLFVASRYWLTEAEGDGEEMIQSNTYMQYFLQGKAQLLSRLNRGNRVNVWQVI